MTGISFNKFISKPPVPLPLIKTLGLFGTEGKVNITQHKHKKFLIKERPRVPPENIWKLFCFCYFLKTLILVQCRVQFTKFYAAIHFKVLTHQPI